MMGTPDTEHTLTEEYMPKVGDRVTVRIMGAPDEGTTLGTASITLTPGASMIIGGKIVEDRGSYWVVELDIRIRGRNRISIIRPYAVENKLGFWAKEPVAQKTA